MATGAFAQSLPSFSSLGAKPNQVKVLTGGGDLREAQVDVPMSVSLPAFDRKAGLNNGLRNSNR